MYNSRHFLLFFTVTKELTAVEDHMLATKMKYTVASMQKLTLDVCTPSTNLVCTRPPSPVPCLAEGTVQDSQNHSKQKQPFSSVCEVTGLINQMLHFHLHKTHSSHIR